MSLPKKLSLKRMGVMNVTPNSFSDGGKFTTTEAIQNQIRRFGPIEALDIGAESTAPMNASISWEEEWERLGVILPLLKNLPMKISLDTYHVETIQQMVRFFHDEKISQDLIWNDVSGKFDDQVRDFLKTRRTHHYVFCHNQAPTRELSGRHMDYVKSLTLEELRDFFSGKESPRVIFDPCLGFSKTFEDNWMILENFGKLQRMLPKNEWLMGFSRKSFLRKKYALERTDLVELDQKHGDELAKLLPTWTDEVWIRTHRPELLMIPAL